MQGVGFAGAGCAVAKASLPVVDELQKGRGHLEGIETRQVRLLEHMLASGLFNDEELEVMRAVFLKLDRDRALATGDIIVGAVMPALVRCGMFINCDLFGWKKELMAMLQESLPEGAVAEDVIHRMIQEKRRERILLAQVASVRDTFRMSAARLLDNAHLLNDSLKDSHLDLLTKAAEIRKKCLATLAKIRDDVTMLSDDQLELIFGLKRVVELDKTDPKHLEDEHGELAELRGRA